MAYPPPYYTERDLDALWELMRSYPFALLMAQVDGHIETVHIPVLSVPPTAEVTEALGSLEGHIAINNPIVAAIEQGAEALVVFSGPHAYISPAWYIESRTVPTWNYQSVQARGVLSRMPDTALMPHLVSIVETFEADAATPWQLATGVAPGYAEQISRGIVGFSLRITQLTGVSKLNQNKSQVDRESVIHHLRAEGGELNHQVAELMEQRLG
jgi:transcriptional regulator